MMNQKIWSKFALIIGVVFLAGGSCPSPSSNSSSNTGGSSTTPTKLTTAAIARIPGSSGLGCFLSEEGLLRCWRDNGVAPNTRMADLQKMAFSDIATTANEACGILRGERKIFCWAFSDKDDPVAELPTSGTNFKFVQMMDQRVLALDEGGRLSVFEKNKSLPDVPSADSYLQMALSADMGCGLTSIGGLKCWSLENSADWEQKLPDKQLHSMVAERGKACAILENDASGICFRYPGKNGPFDDAVAQKKFSAVTVSGIKSICGIGLEDKKITCFNGPVPLPTQTNADLAQKKFRSISATRSLTDGTFCGVLENQTVFCFSLDDKELAGIPVDLKAP